MTAARKATKARKNANALAKAKAQIAAVTRSFAEWKEWEVAGASEADRHAREIARVKKMSDTWDGAKRMKKGDFSPFQGVGWDADVCSWRFSYGGYHICELDAIMAARAWASAQQ